MMTQTLSMLIFILCLVLQVQSVPPLKVVDQPIPMVTSSPEKSQDKPFTHFCEVINNTNKNKHIKLQAFTIDHTHFYLMLSDLVYSIPLTNFDKQHRVLYMYDLTEGEAKRQIQPVKWFVLLFLVEPLKVNLTALHFCALQRAHQHCAVLRRYVWPFWRRGNASLHDTKLSQ